MSSLKNLTILLIGFALLQATLASSNCIVQLFKNSLNDPAQDNLYLWRVQEIPPSYNAPFHGASHPINDPDLEERTISSFRVMVVDDFACGTCTVVAYSGKNLSGRKYEAIGGQVDFDFCVKSFTLKCDADWVEEEEEEEALEEEEEEEI